MTGMYRSAWPVLTATVLLCCLGPCASAAEPEGKPWRSLFEGKSLEQWEVTKFGGEGEVEIDDGSMVLGFGSSLTGVTYKGEVPTNDYELSLEAKRLDGVDFFCGLTFPVQKSHCSLIVGGWAGAVVGLSSIDGMDASQNETTKFMTFKNDQWYRIRVRVLTDRIQAWIDDKLVVDQDIRDRKISTRIEVDLSKPLGIAAWDTKAAIRHVRVRELK